MCVGSLQPDKEELSGENHPQLTIRLLSIPLSTVTFSFCQEIFALFFFLLLCRLFIGNKRSQLLATAGCSARGVIGLLRGDAQPSLYSILKVLVERGYNFGQVEGYDGHEEVVDKHSRFAAAYPPPSYSQERGPFCPLLRGGPVRRNTAPEKKSQQCACWHGLRVSCDRARIEFEEVWGKRKHVPRVWFACTRNWPKALPIANFQV